MIYALIPAAGHSRRMGRPKLALPLGDCTVLEHVLAAMRAADISEILVVTASHVPEVVAIASSSRAHVLVLPQATHDMRETVEHGLKWLDARFRPQPGDAWLLAPADHPCLSADVIRQVSATYIQEVGSIVVPTFRGKRGHPTLLAWKHAAGLLNYSVEAGLNQYIRSVDDQVVELALQSASILEDLDTPEDYVRLSRASVSG